MQPPPGTPAPPDRRPAPSVRVGPLALALGAVAVVTLVGSAVVAPLVTGGEQAAPLGAGAGRDGGGDGEGPDGGTIPEDAPDRWDPRVEDLVEFVEEERDLDFRYPVTVELLGDEAFREEVDIDEEDLTDEELEEIQADVPEMRALGVVAGELDLLDTLGRQIEQGTAAFYDSDEERVVVPSEGDLTVADRITVVHELTHALQDQHFDLDRFVDTGEEAIGGEEDAEEGRDDEPGDEDDAGGGTGDGDTSSYVTALVEGDASRIGTAYVRTLSTSELDDYRTSAQEDLDDYVEAAGDVPSFLEASMATPYTLGEALVAVIAAEGGNAAVDRAFEDPPDTGRHLLVPGSYVEREEVVEPEPPQLPDGAGEPRDEGELDALDLYFMLAERIDPIAALDAADAWRGGQYTVFEDGGQVCMAVTLAGAGSASDGFGAALEDWAAAMPDAAAVQLDEGSESTELLTCDPGTGPELPHDRSDDALTIAHFRSSIAWELMSFGQLDLGAAWEASQCIVGPAREQGLITGTQPSPGSSDALFDIMTECRSV